MKVNRQDYHKGPCCLTIFRDEKAPASKLPLSLLGSLTHCSHLLVHVGHSGTPSSLLSYKDISPFLLGFLLPKPRLSGCLKNGDCIPLQPIHMQREKHRNFYFSRVFSHFTAPVPAAASARGFSWLPPIKLTYFSVAHRGPQKHQEEFKINTFFSTTSLKDLSSHRAARPKIHRVINDSIYIQLPFGNSSSSS